MDKFYKEMISLSELRIRELTNKAEIDSSQDSFSFSLNISPGNLIGAEEVALAKSQLLKCKDKDLLVALVEEFTRQLRLVELQSTNAVIPPHSPAVSPTISEHHYFRSKNNARFCHFDGKRIARELHLSPGKEPTLLISGRDDAAMCQWNLEEARIAEDIGEEITEKEFNKIWFDLGGFPYVRPMRKIRRFLTSIKK